MDGDGSSESQFIHNVSIGHTTHTSLPPSPPPPPPPLSVCACVSWILSQPTHSALIMWKIVRRAKQVYTVNQSISHVEIILSAVSGFFSDAGSTLSPGVCLLQRSPPLLGMVAHSPCLHSNNGSHFRVPVHEE